MLILTEKESVAKIYAQALKLKKTKDTLYENADKTIKVTYAAGHLYQLYEPEDYDKNLKMWNYKTLPVIPQNYKFKPLLDKARNHIRIETEKNIKDAIKKNEEIIIATDPDREGEVIARIILDKCGSPERLLKRIWNCEGVNTEEVIKALKKREDAKLYKKLFITGLNQKESDWVMGINLTRAYTILFNDNSVYSIGRVQTAVLKEIYRKECERIIFRPKKYYEIEVQTKEGVTFYYNKESNVTKKNMEIKEELVPILSSILKKGQIKVSSFNKKIEKEKPPLLYDSAEIQKHAFEIYGLSVEKTLEICQSLYLDKGVISYPRTACRFLKEEDFEELKERAVKLSKHYNIKNFNADLINKDNKRYFNSKKIEGHHALIPCKEFEISDSAEGKVYELILKRFLMMGMEDFILNKVKAYGECEGVILEAQSAKVIQKGWREYDLGSIKINENGEINENGIYNVESAKIIEKETEKPKAYTQSTLLSFMKNPFSKDEEKEAKIYSIGTQATQALIIKTLFERKYIEQKGKSISITDKGIKLIEEIKENEILDKNTDPLSTTRWEEMNEEDPEKFLKYIEKVTRQAIKNLEDKMSLVIEKRKGGICPSCGGELLGGKKGWYCSNYKNGCKNSISYKVMGNDVDEKFLSNLITNKKSEILKGVKQDGSVCEYIWKIDDKGMFTIVFIDNYETICECPLCKKEIRAYPKTYRCSDNECKFFLYRESYGMKFNSEEIKKICDGESVEKIMRKKDGSEAEVSVSLNDAKDGYKIKYKN